jgi:hypothetical protein
MNAFRSFAIDGALTTLVLLVLGCSYEPPSVVKDLRQEVTSATVESVYLPERLVSLRTEDGRLVAVVAGPEVRNLDQVKVGDRRIGALLRCCCCATEETGGRVERSAGEHG